METIRRVFTYRRGRQFLQGKEVSLPSGFVALLSGMEQIEKLCRTSEAQNVVV